MQEVVEDLFEEAKRRDPEGKRQWAVLLDGDPRQMKAVTDRVDKLKKAGFRILVVLDIIHVAEYLWKAANALWGAKSDKRDDWVRHQLFRLLEGKTHVVAHGLRVSAGRKKLKDGRLKAVRKGAEYIENNLDMMHYHDAIKIGLPIATGVIEGACRHLVNDRLGITGARWSLAQHRPSCSCERCIQVEIGRIIGNGTNRKATIGIMLHVMLSINLPNPSILRHENISVSLNNHVLKERHPGSIPRWRCRFSGLRGLFRGGVG